jgi:hypothetical protein
MATLSSFWLTNGARQSKKLKWEIILVRKWVNRCEAETIEDPLSKT